MGDKALIIISSGKEAVDKALTGMMYAYNALKHGWLNDIQVMFFGPSEDLILSDNAKVREMLEKLKSQGVKPFACSAVAKDRGIEAGLMQIGLDVLPVGPLISSLIKKDYAILTF
ncbi:MAG TPA: DsrE family protein [Thermoplasmataceae archaeon]|nr:DsrE family protein [Thermoplasmatales archaeon AK]HLH85991.1 DsrE family protein [Thermoplasmataceae archaeon]